MKTRVIIVLILSLLIHEATFAQGCCSGGGGNPIAGGNSTGVLNKNQLEISGRYQFNYSDVYFSKDSDTLNMIDGLSSSYLFLKVDYGLSDKFTISIASGYYTQKKLVELGQTDTVTSSGISDLILFPRYSVLNKKRENTRTELTLGLGIKIPLSSGEDSTLVGYSGENAIYAISPPTVQVSSGSQDLILYSFLYHGYPKRKLRMFANALYIKKGYNSMGQKFGDYVSMGLFVGKTVFKKIGVTVQLKGEWIDKMQVAKTVSEIDLAVYGIDMVSTGSKKVFFIPQLSYTEKNLTLFVTTEVPLYQYLNGVQAGSLYQVTAGLTYRLFVKKQKVVPENTFELVPIPK